MIKKKKRNNKAKQNKRVEEVEEPADAQTNQKTVINLNTTHLAIGGVLAFVVLFFAVYSVGYSQPAEGTVTTTTLESQGGSQNTGGVSAQDDVIKIPLSDISKNVKKFTYDYAGRTIKYMVVLGTDGEPRTAFDACEVCGGAKGYRQEGTDVACINCGRRFMIDDLGSKNKGGGCWPSYLPHTIEDGNILIKASDIKTGSRYF